jgi:salicylate hydroxylase
MAIEDAAVLGKLFEHVSHVNHIAPLLYAYESLRHARASATQASSRDNQRIFHLPDGPQQRERDEMMRAAMQAELEGKLDAVTADAATKGNPNQWADRSKNRIQFGYDAEGEADSWWEREGKTVLTKIDEQEALKQKAKL